MKKGKKKKGVRRKEVNKEAWRWGVREEGAEIPGSLTNLIW